MDGLHIGVMKEILLDAVLGRFSKFTISQNGGNHKSLISLHIYDHSFQTFRTHSQKRIQGQPRIYSKSGAQEFRPSLMVLKSFSNMFQHFPTKNAHFQQKNVNFPTKKRLTNWDNFWCMAHHLPCPGTRPGPSTSNISTKRRASSRSPRATSFNTTS